MARRAASLAAAAAAVFFLGPEAAHFALTRHGDVPEARDHCRVLVLGNPAKKDGTPSEIQRYRVRAGVDALRRYRCASLILSGGDPHSTTVEADVMAGVAAALGVEKERVVLERRARNTWENLKFSFPELEDGEHLFLASDAFHVRRALWYAGRQRPDLEGRIHDASEHGPARLAVYRWYECWGNAAAMARDWWKYSKSDANSGRVK